MEFPKNTKNVYVDGSFEFNIERNYLTSDEINGIIKVAAQEKDYVMRENMIDALVAKYATDIKEFKEDNIDTEFIDICRANNVFGEIRTYLYDYIDMIYSGIIMETSVNAQVRDIVEYAKVKLDELPKTVKGLSNKKISDNVIKAMEKFSETIKAQQHLDDTMKN